MAFNADDVNIFDVEETVAKIEERLEKLAEVIRDNIMTKTRNSGARVNSLLLPADTSNETARSIKVVREKTDEGLTIALVGRKGVMSIDAGQSPEEIRAEHGSFQAFVPEIEKWARAKEMKYGLLSGEINEWSAASNLWSKGTVLYRDGGGKESITEAAAAAAVDIDEIANEINETVYTAVKSWVV